MATAKTKEKTVNKPGDGKLELTGITVLPGKSVLEKSPRKDFKYRYTTGPFLLPENSASLDWALLNNDKTAQSARVTVFKCPIGAAKSAVPPGAIVVTVAPGENTHNANTYDQGFSYEIEVECNSRLLFPYVSVWPGNFGVVIPGTGITSGSFLRVMP